MLVQHAPGGLVQAALVPGDKCSPPSATDLAIRTSGTCTPKAPPPAPPPPPAAGHAVGEYRRKIFYFRHAPEDGPPSRRIMDQTVAHGTWHRGWRIGVISARRGGSACAGIARKGRTAGRRGIATARQVWDAAHRPCGADAAGHPLASRRSALLRRRANPGQRPHHDLRVKAGTSTTERKKGVGEHALAQHRSVLATERYGAMVGISSDQLYSLKRELQERPGRSCTSTPGVEPCVREWTGKVGVLPATTATCAAGTSPRCKAKGLAAIHSGGTRALRWASTDARASWHGPRRRRLWTTAGRAAERRPPSRTHPASVDSPSPAKRKRWLPWRRTAAPA